ncbi:hypothetical protein AOQ84DRAFT_365423 [Glonium stellatum]|uniref:BTB domain-containing protein n=1 Tax=Glonium stellatum TaxID=574774 RepID=A0A8E2JRK3_9PEZI|nr:hypothetical protein AOQ84DRAFT_365423 [Glonium stellatum]
MTAETSTQVLDYDLARFLVDGTFSDLTLHYGGQSSRVHKIVLSSQSRWFSRMLEKHLKELESNDLMLKDDWSWAVKAMLSFLYSKTYLPVFDIARQVHVNMTLLDFNVHVYRIADKYEVPALCRYALDGFQRCAKATLAVPGGDYTSFVRALSYIYRMIPSKSDPLRMEVILLVKEYVVKLSRNNHFARLLLNMQDFHDELVAAFVEDGMEFKLVKGSDDFHFR